MARITLNSLKCVKKSGDAGGNDEVYLELRTDGLHGRLPGEETYWEMGDGETVTINRTYEFLNEFTVEGKEKDTGKDDVLGEFTFKVGATPPSSPLYWTGHESQYELSFTYVA